MKLSLLTLTRDRPKTFALCERWMTRQATEWHEWIVADQGSTPATCTMGQKVIRNPVPLRATNEQWFHERDRFRGRGDLVKAPKDARVRFTENMIYGLQAVTGDAVVIIEDDDWYPARYLADVMIMLEEGADVVGSNLSRYYNWPSKVWDTKEYTNLSAMYQTAFRNPSRVIEFCRAKLEELKKHRRADDVPGLEHSIWEDQQGLSADLRAVGMKGLAGCFGVSVRHHVTEEAWIRDEDRSKIREWIGADADIYMETFGP